MFNQAFFLLMLGLVKNKNFCYKNLLSERAERVTAKARAAEEKSLPVNVSKKWDQNCFYFQQKNDEGINWST